MTDTIRWCYTCKDRPFDNPGFNGCAEGHDVADALVVRADQSIVVESDVPDGQGYDWVIAQVPQSGRYMLVRIGDST